MIQRIATTAFLLKVLTTPLNNATIKTIARMIMIQIAVSI